MEKEIITQQEIDEMAIIILEEAISRIKGNKYKNVWQGMRGISFDAIERVQTVIDRI